MIIQELGLKEAPPPVQQMVLWLTIALFLKSSAEGL